MTFYSPYLYRPKFNSGSGIYLSFTPSRLTDMYCQVMFQGEGTDKEILHCVALIWQPVIRFVSIKPQVEWHQFMFHINKNASTVSTFPSKSDYQYTRNCVSCSNSQPWSYFSKLLVQINFCIDSREICNPVITWYMGQMMLCHLYSNTTDLNNIQTIVTPPSFFEKKQAYELLLSYIPQIQFLNQFSEKPVPDFMTLHSTPMPFFCFNFQQLEINMLRMWNLWCKWQGLQVLYTGEPKKNAFARIWGKIHIHGSSSALVKMWLLAL